MYIFDFDGTLMDTSAVILATIKATIEQMHLPERTDEQCRSIIGIRTDEAARYLYPELEVSNEDFARNFRANYLKIKATTREHPYPGVLDTLSELRRRGQKLAIASSRREDSLHDYLRELGIDSWFAVVVGAESVKHGKPDPEPVLQILQRLQCPGEQALVVGDANVDIEMGNRAGCLTCAVTYGNGSEAALRAARPNFIISNFPEILNINPAL